VLGDARDDVIALLAVHLADALDRKVVRLGRAAREDEFLSRWRRMRSATCLRAARRPSSASHPNGWLRLAALPNFPVNTASSRRAPAGRQGVVA
jgi:hypothetical protein